MSTWAHGDVTLFAKDPQYARNNRAPFKGRVEGFRFRL